MKRRDFERYLAASGCSVRREGAAHTIYVNAAATKAASVPRHNELKTFTVRSVCKQLGIPPPAMR